MARRGWRTDPKPGQTKAERLAWERLRGSLWEADDEGFVPYRRLAEIVPEAWDHLHRDVDVTEKKVRLTLMLDESVAKFYRAQGRGSQARMNRVLATWAQMQIANVNSDNAWWAEFRRLRKQGMEFDEAAVKAREAIAR